MFRFEVHSCAPEGGHMAAGHDIEEDVPPLGLRVWAATSLNRYDADGNPTAE